MTLGAHRALAITPAGHAYLDRKKRLTIEMFIIVAAGDVQAATRHLAQLTPQQEWSFIRAYAQFDGVNPATLYDLWHPKVLEACSALSAGGR